MLKPVMLIWLPLILLLGCTPLPRAEGADYRQTFDAFRNVSMNVLDIVTPYERAATRKRSYVGADCPGESNLVLTQDPFCYGIRDQFATIGDPTLVGSYRNLIEVVSRFNAIVVAYSEGVSIRVLTQDVAEFATFVDAFGTAASVNGAVDSAIPLATQAANLRDRRELLSFLAENHELVERAFEEMSLRSGRLYGTVNSGTAILTANKPSLRASLNPRRREIRTIIANWTVLIDETKEVFGKLQFALNNANNLEVRLRNLDDTKFEINAGFVALQGQIAEIGSNSAFE